MFRKVVMALIIAILSCSVASAEERLDTDITNVNLTSALQGVARKSGMELALNQKLEGNVILVLQNKTAEETLAALSKVASFNWDIENNVIYASPADVGTQVNSYPVKYADMKEIKKSLALFISENKISINELDSTVQVEGTAFQQLKTAKLLSRIDIPQKQIYLKSKFIEISHNKARNLGVNYGMPSYDSSITSGIKLQWTATMNAEDTFSEGKTLAQPNVSTINGREAKITVGDSIPVFSTIVSTDGTRQTTVTDQDVGIYVTATPRINEDGTITTKIKITVKAITQWITSGYNKAPQISTRKAITRSGSNPGKLS